MGIKMIFSDEYFEGLKKIALEYCFRNYDYCYLSAMHEKNRIEGTKTIVVGSSHAMNGIIERLFDERPQGAGKADLYRMDSKGYDARGDLLWLLAYKRKK